MSEQELRDMETKEFDVDTGTYVEDVHANDSIVGRDADSDGLIDSVEMLIEAAAKNADAYNAEQARQREKSLEEKDSVKEDGRDALGA